VGEGLVAGGGAVILPVAFALVVLSVPLAGGRLGRLVELRIRHSWIIITALVVQTMVITVVPGIGQDAGNVVHLATYAMSFGFLALNHRIVGMKLLAVGGGLNLVAIVANGGVMPASAWATRTAGVVADPSGFTNSRAVDEPRLLLLGDVLAIPERWPLANVFSIGDVVLVIGAAVLLHAGSGSRLARGDRGGTRPAGDEQRSGLAADHA
jgi:hypothetical protein